MAHQLTHVKANFAYIATTPAMTSLLEELLGLSNPSSCIADAGRSGEVHCSTPVLPLHLGLMGLLQLTQTTPYVISLQPRRLTLAPKSLSLCLV